MERKFFCLRCWQMGGNVVYYEIMDNLSGGEDLEKLDLLFLEAVRCSLKGQPLTFQAEPRELEQLLELAQQHHILPMIYEVYHASGLTGKITPVLSEQLRRATIHTVMGQAVKTVDFLKLSQHLKQEGVQALVVKGIVCRSLYPMPDHRGSGDEDLLCGEAQFSRCHQAMVQFGMEPEGDCLEGYEISYRKPDSPLYIELHKSLFAPNNDVFKDYNRFFEEAFDRSIEVEIRGMPVATLCHTDHILYLIIHAYKHFLHSGFGIRQVCDMALFASTFGDEIDWDYVHRCCHSIRAHKFAAALWRIAEKYLDFSPEEAGLTPVWREISVDEEPLLADMLQAGIYGSADLTRVHTSNITINAVAAQKKGQKPGGNVIRTIFPKARALENQYPYLRRRKYLLPVAWTSRFVSFAKENVARPESTSQVLRTGSKRVELLKLYDIIDH